jgi:chorismate synthase
VLSGIFEGKTTGTPICALIYNKDAKSKDYDHLKKVYRPGHADKVWQQKFGHRDHRGGGRSSGRETVGRVIAGVVAKKILFHACKTQIIGHTISLKNLKTSNIDYDFIEQNPLRTADRELAPQMIALVEKAKEEKDSLGGEVQIDILLPPRLIGEPVFGKIEGELARAIMSIGAVRSFGVGAGFAAGSMSGYRHNQLLEGTSGGITTGNDFSITLAVKPTSTIGKQQKAESTTGEEVTLEAKGRHDPVIIPRLIPVAEAMCALVLVDYLLEKPSQMSQILER